VKSILILAQAKTQLNELLRAAIRLKAAGHALQVCIDNGSQEIAAEMARACEAAGVPANRLTEFAGLPSARLPGRSRRRRELVASFVLDKARTGAMIRLLQMLVVPDSSREKLALSLAGIREYYKLEASNLAAATALVAKCNPDVVLVGEDGLGGNASVIVAAREAGARVVIIPYEFSTRTQILEKIAGTPEAREAHRCNGPGARTLARWFPKWATVHNGEKIVRMNPEFALAREAHGLAPCNPWTVHGGHADILAAESEAMLEHYRREGLPESKLRLVGALGADDVASFMQGDPASMASFQSGTKRLRGSTAVLCALPPDYTDERPGLAAFASYRELIDAWLAALTALPDAKLTFQLHPALRPEDAALVRERVPVSDANITQLIACCDILVTSVSSIIRLAIAARKPVVNFDVYRFNYPDYVGAPGVFHVRDPADFRNVLAGLVSGALYDEAIASMKTSSHRWGTMDGKSGERLNALISE
jgi:hypothetical protein